MNVLEIVKARLDHFASRHSLLMLVATLLLASLTTIALLGQTGTAGTLVLYEGF